MPELRAVYQSELPHLLVSFADCNIAVVEDVDLAS